MLKGEEEKNLRKIEVTRRKTDKKMAQQAKNEEDFRRKIEFKNRKDKELEMKREQNKKLKENNKCMNVKTRRKKTSNGRRNYKFTRTKKK